MFIDKSSLSVARNEDLPHNESVSTLQFYQERRNLAILVSRENALKLQGQTNISKDIG